MKTQNRIIRVDSCNSCPFNGECKAWKKLTSKQRVKLSISTAVPQNFMLADCHLEEEK